MGRKRPETKLNQISRMLIEVYQPKSVQDIQDAIKYLLGDTVENMLKADFIFNINNYLDFPKLILETHCVHIIARVCP